VIAGADTGPRSVDLPARTLASGIRLRPGAPPARCSACRRRSCAIARSRLRGVWPSTRRASLASRASAAGYASQAHMSDEVRRLTGTTPVRFLEDAQLTAA